MSETILAVRAVWPHDNPLIVLGMRRSPTLSFRDSSLVILSPPPVYGKQNGPRVAICGRSERRPTTRLGTEETGPPIS
jgi:hypothetical protein